MHVFAAFSPCIAVMFLPSAPSPGLHPHPGNQDLDSFASFRRDERNCYVCSLSLSNAVHKILAAWQKKSLDHKPWQHPTSVNSTNNIRTEKWNVAALRFCEGLRVEKGVFSSNSSLCFLITFACTPTPTVLFCVLFFLKLCGASSCAHLQWRPSAVWWRRRAGPATRPPAGGRRRPWPGASPRRPWTLPWVWEGSKKREIIMQEVIVNVCKVGDSKWTISIVLTELQQKICWLPVLFCSSLLICVLPLDTSSPGLIGPHEFHLLLLLTLDLFTSGLVTWTGEYLLSRFPHDYSDDSALNLLHFVPSLHLSSKVFPNLRQIKVQYVKCGLWFLYW